MPDKLFMPTHPSSPFSHAYTRTHHQPDSSPPGLTQWACYINASAYGSRVGWTPARTIHTYIHTSLAFQLTCAITAQYFKLVFAICQGCLHYVKVRDEGLRQNNGTSLGLAVLQLFCHTACFQCNHQSSWSRRVLNFVCCTWLSPLQTRDDASLRAYLPKTAFVIHGVNCTTVVYKLT